MEILQLIKQISSPPLSSLWLCRLCWGKHTQGLGVLAQGHFGTFAGHWRNWGLHQKPFKFFLGKAAGNNIEELRGEKLRGAREDSILIFLKETSHDNPPPPHPHNWSHNNPPLIHTCTKRANLCLTVVNYFAFVGVKYISQPASGTLENPSTKSLMEVVTERLTAVDPPPPPHTHTHTHTHTSLKIPP